LEYFKNNAILDFRTMLTALKESKDKISNFKNQISNLTKENNLLKTRGNLSIEELTPRPSFNQVKIKKEKNRINRKLSFKKF